MAIKLEVLQIKWIFNAQYQYICQDDDFCSMYHSCRYQQALFQTKSS
jgi:hypothetical protein